MNVVAVIPLKKGFNHWYSGFQEHRKVRSTFCDEARTRVMQDHDNPDTVSVFLYNVDQSAMAMFESDEFRNFALELGEDVEHKEVFITS